MKIFISADLEGINGVVSPEDIIPGESGYEIARVLMTEEINTVVKGLFEAGVDEVVVCDSHEIAQNIRFDLLDERVALIRGATRLDSMVHGIDSSFDGMILLGHHAMFGTQDAVLDHSYDQHLIRELRMNDTAYGEVGINALYASEQGVPLIMATGDKALYNEVKEFYHKTEVAVVKYAEGRYCARCIPKKDCHELLYTTAKKAVQSIKDKECIPIPKNIEMKITFQQVSMADGAMRVKGVRRIAPMVISYECSSMKEFMEMRQVIFQAASEFYNNKF